MATFIRKKPSPGSAPAQPRFELDQFGKDVTEHNGIRWIYLPCPYCNAHARFIPVESVVVESEDDLGMKQKDYHCLCKCEHCESVIYVKFWEVDFDPDWHFAYEMHTPSASDGSFEAVDLPTNVRDSFEEARKCLNAQAHLACVVMCRRCVEAVLTDKGQRKGESLYSAIKRLANEKVLHESMGQLADIVRLVGNSGAHNTKTEIDSKQAHETFDLTRQLIDLLYIIPRKHADIKAKIRPSP